MPQNTTIWLQNAEKTHFAGSSLAASLYTCPVTVLLTGELGAGKTTFLQGFAHGLGIKQSLTSPTYALEQRYQTQSHGELLHLDLYRLSPKEAQKIVLENEDYTGIRCIEWADRLEPPIENAIEIHLTEKDNGRQLEVVFNDMPLPSRAQILAWREEVHLLEHIGRHCDAVAALSVKIGNKLLRDGAIVRLEALERAGEVHDLFRFVDFKSGASHFDHTPTKEQEEVWAVWKERFTGHHHEPACMTFLQEKGYGELGEIVKTHGFKCDAKERTTIEQKILFYADKRMRVDELVSLEERFADFAARYTDGKQSKDAARWQAETEAIEKELLVDF